VRAHTDVTSQPDLIEGTSMLGIAVGKNFELRPEFRIDSRGQDACLHTARDDQITGTLAALAYF
jgi:hypothetical protein